jgi:hypothetical protein
MLTPTQYEKTKPNQITNQGCGWLCNVFLRSSLRKKPGSKTKPLSYRVITISVNLIALRHTNGNIGLGMAIIIKASSSRLMRRS